MTEVVPSSANTVCTTALLTLEEYNIYFPYCPGPLFSFTKKLNSFIADVNLDLFRGRRRTRHPCTAG
jgi:hypothetical protein